MADYDKKCRGVQVTTAPAELHFPHLVKPRLNEKSGKNEFSALLTWDKSDKAALKDIKLAIRDALKSGYPDATKEEMASLRYPLLDGDQYVPKDPKKTAMRDAVVGRYYINVKSAEHLQPKTFARKKDADGKAVPLDAAKFEPLDIVRAELNIKAHQNDGCSAYLNGLMLWVKGEGLPEGEGGGARVSLFDDLDLDLDDDDDDLAM